MNQLYVAALELQQFCVERNWKFCVIGGLAVGRWGRPRTTRDVDISLLTGFDNNEEGFVDELLAHYKPRRPDARDFALTNRVLLIAAANGVPIDVGLAAISFEEQLIGRAKKIKYTPAVSLVTIMAEDLIVLKSTANRPIDWADIDNILARQRNKLDWQWITQSLTELCAMLEDDAALQTLLRRKEELDRE